MIHVAGHAKDKITAWVFAGVPPSEWHPVVTIAAEGNKKKPFDLFFECSAWEMFSFRLILNGTALLCDL